MKARLLFVLLVTPLGVLGRPLWRRRLGLGIDKGADSYFVERARTPIGANDLKQSS